MPSSWTSKDERQYRKIRESNLDRGMPEDRAEEVAARTVNKTRRKQGRTQNQRTSGTGNPNSSLTERSRDELYNIARRLKIDGRSKMTKRELATAIRASRD
jgi:hypothetical protein